MRIIDWSSDVCSSDLLRREFGALLGSLRGGGTESELALIKFMNNLPYRCLIERVLIPAIEPPRYIARGSQSSLPFCGGDRRNRSEARRIGKAGVSTCRFRWWAVHYKKKKRKSE